MNYVYLVCTRAAISGSALTYIINQSSDFYNHCHNNLWAIEKNDTFTDANTINDWWNIPPQFKQYTTSIRNTNKLTEQQLHDISFGWQELAIDKNICIFTHAENIEEIISIVNEYNLAIKIVTTRFGENFYKYIDMFLSREYSVEMNIFEDIYDTVSFIALQYKNDLTYYNDNCVSFEVDDWLGNTDKIYKDLNVTNASHINVWVNHYREKNKIDSMIWDTSSKSTVLKIIFKLYKDLKLQQDKNSNIHLSYITNLVISNKLKFDNYIHLENYLKQNLLLDI